MARVREIFVLFVLLGLAHIIHAEGEEEPSEDVSTAYVSLLLGGLKNGTSIAHNQLQEILQKWLEELREDVSTAYVSLLLDFLKNGTSMAHNQLQEFLQKWLEELTPKEIAKKAARKAARRALVHTAKRALL